MGINFIDLTGLPEAANSQSFISRRISRSHLAYCHVEKSAGRKGHRHWNLGEKKIAAETARNYFNVYGREF
jgi:hypothetical protein